MWVKDPERAGRTERKRRRMKAGLQALPQVLVWVNSIPSLSSILREGGAGESGGGTGERDREMARVRARVRC